MKLIEKPIFIVLKLTRGSSVAQGAFGEEDHAEKFIVKMNTLDPGTYVAVPSTLYDFEPSPGEI